MISYYILYHIILNVLAAMMKNRREAEVEHTMGATQFGFRKGKSPRQAIYIARRTQGFAERAGLRAQVVILGWEKAFDKISHAWLMKALESCGFPQE